MKNRKVYQIATTIKGSRITKTSIDLNFLVGWDASTLDAAFRLCRVATEMYGLVFWVVLETEKTLTVWVDDASWENYKAAQPKPIRKTRNTAKVS